MAADDLLNLYTASLRERGLSKRSIETYRWILRTADRDLPHGLDVATTDELRLWLGRDLEPSTRAYYRSALRGFFAFCVDELGELDYNPALRLRRPKVPEKLPRIATMKAAELILTTAREPYRLWARLACYAGLRCIEIHRLHREDVTDETIHVHRGKGDKARQVPTHPVLWAVLRDLPEGPVTHVRDEKVLSNSFGNYARRVLGTRGASLHRLRGWFGTEAYRASLDPRAVQVLLGHSSLDTTMRYIGWSAQQTRDAVTGVPTFGGEPGEGDAGRREEA